MVKSKVTLLLTRTNHFVFVLCSENKSEIVLKKILCEFGPEPSIVRANLLYLEMLRRVLIS